MIARTVRTIQKGGPVISQKSVSKISEIFSYIAALEKKLWCNETCAYIRNCHIYGQLYKMWYFHRDSQRYITGGLVLGLHTDVVWGTKADTSRNRYGYWITLIQLYWCRSLKHFLRAWVWKGRLCQIIDWNALSEFLSISAFCYSYILYSTAHVPCDTAYC